MVAERGERDSLESESEGRRREEGRTGKMKGMNRNRKWRWSRGGRRWSGREVVSLKECCGGIGAANQRLAAGTCRSISCLLAWRRRRLLHINDVMHIINYVAFLFTNNNRSLC